MATETSPAGTRAAAVMEVIRSRRVTRSFTAEPVSEADLRTVLEAGRWASSAGNRRIHKFLVVRDPARIQLVRTMAPGMLAVPTALILICTDTTKAAAEQVQLEKDASTLIDVGTAAMNMMLAAHGLGLGTCPVTSFSQSGVQTVLDLPATLIPEFILLVGHRAPQRRVMRQGASTKLTVDDLTYWERYGHTTPE